MDSRGKYLIKNTGILTVSNFASKILVFLLVPLYTSVLSTDDVGFYDLTISTVTLLYPILTMNIVDSVMRFSMDRENAKDDIISISLRFIAISWVISGGILFILRIVGVAPQLNQYAILIYLYFVFFTFHQLLIQFAKGLERVADMGIDGVVGTLSLLSANILFLIFFRAGLRGFFISIVLSQALTSLYLFFRLRFWHYFKLGIIDKQLQHEMLIYCIPLIATSLGWWVNSASDKYVVAFICGVSANGLLSVAYKIPSILNVFQSIFIQAWQISAIKEYGPNDTAVFYGRAFIIINTLLCAACAWLIILTKQIALILFQNTFYVAWQYVPFLIISCVINSAAGFLGPILSAKKASKPMALSAVYGASANIILNIVLVYLIGIQGATIATVVSSYIIYHVRKNAVGDEIIIKRYGTVIITWILLLVQAVLEVYTSYWWFEVFLMVLMLIINWNAVKDLFIVVLNLIHVRKGYT